MPAAGRAAEPTLALLVKLARALKLDALRIGDVRLHAASLDDMLILEAWNAIIAARKVVDAAASAKAELVRITERFQRAVARAVSSLDVDGVDACSAIGHL